MTYNNAGQITSDSKFRNANFTYDANGRMRSATQGGATATSTYDAAGMRVQSVTGGTTRRFIYDAFGKLVAEYVGSTLDKENIYQGGALLATRTNNTVGWVMQDVQGSTRLLTNGNGDVTERHDYLPFGDEITAGIGTRTVAQGYTGVTTTREKFALTERDEASQMEHTWFRKLDTKSGRWSTPDPYLGSMSLGEPQSMNRYSYVQNDPVNFIDPSGLCYLRISYTEWVDGNGRVVSITNYRTELVGCGGGSNSGNNSGGGERGGGRQNSNRNTQTQQQTEQQRRQDAEHERLKKFKDCFDKAIASRNQAERRIENMGESVLPGADDIGPAVIAGIATGSVAAARTSDPRGGAIVGVATAAGSIGYSLGAVPVWKYLKNVRFRLNEYAKLNKEFNKALDDCHYQYGRRVTGGSW